jgi:hypothetical protein
MSTSTNTSTSTPISMSTNMNTKRRAILMNTNMCTRMSTFISTATPTITRERGTSIHTLMRENMGRTTMITGTTTRKHMITLTNRAGQI